MRLRCLAIALALAPFGNADAQSHGLNTRPSFVAFNGNALPPNASTISGTWSTVAAWPGLTFQNPLGIAQEPGAQSMIVWEREGRVYRFDKATGGNKTLILDLSSNTQGWDDCGLLNLVFHPNYASNRYLFIYYCWVPGPTSIKGNYATRPPTFMTNWKRLSRFTVKPDGTIDKASETVLVHQKSQCLWHSGSGMFFHPGDGFLYFINGEDFYPSKAQKLDGGLFSGIFRIDVDNRGGSISHAIPRQPLPGPANDTGSYTQNYMIPNDNPLVGQSNVLEEYFALGVRSPHRLAFDSVSNRMFHSDVGDASREEINVVEPGDVLPNYQWPRFEGLIGDMTPPYIGQNKKPVIDYTHADGSAVIGGLVYRGSAFPELKGKYIFGDNMNGTIWYLDESTTPASKIAIAKMPNGPGPNAGDNYCGLSSFGVDADGELYMTRMSYTGGAVMKLSRTGGNTNTMPATLSQTGLFSDLATLTPATGFIAYDVNTPLWSDNALKQRWFAVPDGLRIGYSPTGEWSFPTGSVFLKHFDLITDETNPDTKRRLETRVLVRDNQGFVYGGSYKWRADLSDADLVSDSNDENITITTASGTRLQAWTFPGRQACLQCHTQASKGILGLNTPQTHRDHLFTETNVTDNQLRAWSHVGLFTPAIEESSLASLTKFAAIDDTNASVELRARSYLDSNCSHCHRPGGGGKGYWDARIETPLAGAGIVNGRVLNDLGEPGSRIVAPQNLSKSVLRKRLATATENYAMPPIAKHLVDANAVALIEQWINALPVPAPQPVAAPWTTQDIGNTAMAGSAVELEGQFTLQASGADFGGSSDDMRFVYRSLTGDGTLVAHWVSGANESAGTLAGITMRETLAADAKQVSMLHMPGQTKHVYRITNSNLGAGHYADMSWLRIRRAGSVFTSSISNDGVTWTQVDQRSISMAATIKVGLCVCGRDNSKLASEVFDNVQFMPVVPWLIDTQPQSQLVRTGDLVEFSVGTLGDAPTSYQWRKNNVSITRAVASRFAFKAALASAGSFNVLTGGKLLSSSANLVVLDKVTYTNNLPPNSTATFTLSYAGTGATFAWTKDGVPLQSSARIVGAGTSKLSVKALTLADIGVYECVVSAFGSTQVLGPFPLHVLSKPSITSAAPPTWSVSRAFAWQLTSDEPVTSFLVKGLPSGLTYNSKTGLVSGTPNVGGAFTITVSASNAAGTGLVQSYTFNVDTFPTAAGGAFSALVDRDVINNQLGGLLRLSITTSGVATGKLTLGTAVHSLSGRAEFISGQHPTLRFTTAGTPGKLVALTIGQFDGVVTGDVNGTPVHGRRQLGSESVATYNTELLQPDASPALPQGAGWVRISVNAIAGVTFLGRLADNSLISLSSAVNDDETIPLYLLLYGGKGSLQGAPQLAGSNVSGSIGWLKISSTDHNYASGFPLTTLTANGRKFAAIPSGGTFLGLTSAGVEFTAGGISSAAATNKPNQNFTLTTAHTAVFSKDYVNVNPCYDTMTITPATGYFTGTLKLKDGALLRTVSYQGLFLNGASEAHGFFLLTQLPGTTTSPVLSGAVRIFGVP